jgi:hypothetical protein
LEVLGRIIYFKYRVSDALVFVVGESLSWSLVIFCIVIILIGS